MYAPESPDANFYTGISTKGNEISYPVHIYHIEMSKMYMQRIRWHWHPELEILIIEQGEIRFTTDDREVRLKAGQGILINQNVMHALQPVDPKLECTLYSAMFHPSILFGYGNTALSGKYLAPVLTSPAFKTMILDKEDPVSAELMDDIYPVITLNLEKDYGYELLTKSWLCQFWVLLLEKVAPHTAAASKPNALSLDETRVKEAIIYIEKHYFEPITLEHIAASVHISKSECCRCFKRALQLTPIEYLMRYRILRAATLMQDNAPSYRTISDLAFSVGFNNVSYFNKVFKQYIKCTPSEYKKHLRTSSSANSFSVTTS